MSFILVNKKIVNEATPSVRHNDRGFTLGHGLFETLLAKDGLVFAFNYHWRRLKVSARSLGIPLPFTASSLKSMIQGLLIKNKLQEGIASVRLTLTHGEAERGLLPIKPPRPNFLISAYKYVFPMTKCFSALIVNTRKNEQSLAASIKSISYLDNILAKREARAKNYEEAILLNSHSNVADGSFSNVFMVKNNQVLTPFVKDGALPGVIRAILLEECSDLFSVKETSISLAELYCADEIFLTNVLLGIQSVHKLGDRSFNTFTKANTIRDVLQEKKQYPVR